MRESWSLKEKDNASCCLPSLLTAFKPEIPSCEENMENYLCRNYLESKLERILRDKRKQWKRFPKRMASKLHEVTTQERCGRCITRIADRCQRYRWERHWDLEEPAQHRVKPEFVKCSESDSMNIKQLNYVRPRTTWKEFCAVIIELTNRARVPQANNYILTNLF